VHLGERAHDAMSRTAERAERCRHEEEGSHRWSRQEESGFQCAHEDPFCILSTGIFEFRDVSESSQPC
jgi:hypothetical protein